MRSCYPQPLNGGHEQGSAIKVAELLGQWRTESTATTGSHYYVTHAAHFAGTDK